jgi:ubiquinol-cytochrome c reductase cytochrome c subunit
VKRLVIVGCAVAAALAAVATVAWAGSPPIVRPASERGLSQHELGAELFAANCSACHGIDGRGVTGAPQQGTEGIEGLGPSLRGVGAQAVDFYLCTGYMPLGDPHDQPIRSRVLLHDHEVRALVNYVASLEPGPGVPKPKPQQGSVADGRELFTEHCAGCHQVVAEGGILTGAKAPPLDKATPVQIAEAVRIGPYVMPKFSRSDISDSQLNSIIAYVQYTKNPRDAGGWGISHLGPFPEGMVVWLIAMVVLLAICRALGKGLRREEGA